MKAEDCSDMTFIHRKVFNDPAVAGDGGTLVHIYYKYDEKKNNLLVEDYSIHFIIDGKVGANVASNEEEIDDELYRFLFRTTYQELLDNVIFKNKK